MLKKFFQVIGFIFLISFSFFYTEKAITVVREHDPIMVELRDLSSNYQIDPINVTFVEDKCIIPGYNGIAIDINKSYSNMRRFGKFNESLIVNKEIVPDKTINKIYDKYIVKGNKVKESVSLIFKVKNDTYIDIIFNILNNEGVKATFFIDGYWMENNLGVVKYILDNNHELANLGYNNNYDRDFFLWTNNKFKQLFNKEMKYCYTEDENEYVLDLCKDYGMHTIMPNIVITKYPFIEVKNNLEPGSIISFNINEQVKRELPMIINFIKSKGYTITLLGEHLSEERL
ncbi:MAG: polysaccharide deacetylase family protein [Bacilli bacterium]|nr:polysaccharide deacetylase family protein [Bacilli bacterium]